MISSVITVKLKHLLEERNKSIFQLHKETDITYPTLHKIASGKGEGISFKVLEKLCENLGCFPSDLLFYEPNSTPQTVKPQTVKVGTKKRVNRPGTPQTTGTKSDSMTVGEVMSYLGKSESSVLRYIKKYKLLKAEKIGQSWKILRKDVLEFEKSDFYINEVKR
jgi:DNA-binding Xre family transcriptional regulator/predicted DNA-binding transcriptional regulator AlpA